MDASGEPLSLCELRTMENDAGEALACNMPWVFTAVEPVTLATYAPLQEVLCNAVTVYGRDVTIMPACKGPEIAIDETNLELLRQPLVRLSIC